MAYSVRVRGISKEKWIMLELEPPWWDADELMKDRRFLSKNETGSYDDYSANLSVEEAKVIHDRFRASATTGIYEHEAWQKKIQPILESLDRAFEKYPDKYSHFHITVFEWDSGY